MKRVEIETAIHETGFVTQGQAQSLSFMVMNWLAEEREACARLCDERAKDKPGKLPSPQAYKDEAMLCAAKIRAR